MALAKTYMYAHNLMQAGHFEFQTADVADGPRNAEIWTSSVWFNQINPVYRQCVGQIFVGTGRTKAEARDMAAYTALCAIGAIARSS
ncbi:hypothetical protein FRC00_002868 [Tulasnella sp. 408]|nr:hypothetical protein FRC00_002868 [Tulasnella sp. 408]